MHLVIAKIDEVFFDGEADSLTVPGSEGEMTVLPEHEPFITVLKSGVATVKTAHETKQIPISSGLLEVRPDGATVIL
jgi:F-type H+-transporting ATPase subunit epsilon